jgi:carbamoyl-phosphate synthase large subunit
MGVQPNHIAPKGSAAILYSEDPGAAICAAAKKLSKWFDVKTISGSELESFDSISQEKAVELMRLHKAGIVVTEGSHIGSDYVVRRGAADLNVPLVLNGRLGLALAEAMGRKGFGTESLECSEMGEYW